MKIAFNPSTVAALIAPPNNKDITFDLRGRNIFARGVKFQGTDTWRDIKINNISIDSNILDLQNGSNTTLTNTNGVVTINSTQRPVVDNLTSDSTTSSLSANQGRVLAGLINSKSDSEHNHDDRYLRLTGGIMQLGEGLKFHADNNYFGTDSDARIISLLYGNGKVCDGGLIIDERGTLDGIEYITELLRIRDSEFKWKGSNILHNGNSYINGNTITINNFSISVSKSDHTHTWQSITNKVAGGNEFNIVNAGYNSQLWFNYLPIDNRNSSAAISQYNMGNGNKGLASVYAYRFKAEGKSCMWKDARNYAPFYATYNGGFEPILDIKTVSGDWSIGSYDSYGNHLVFAYTSDSDFNAGRNGTAQYWLSVGGEFKINTLRLAGSINANMGVGSTNPQIIFAEGSAIQQVALTYTDWDSYRTSKGLKVHSYDGSDDSNVWFEVQGYNYSSGYVKNGSSDAYVLLGGGGHKPLSEFQLGSGSYLPYNGWWSSGSGQDVNDANGMIFAYANHKNTPFSSAWGIITTFDYTYNSNYKFQLAANGYSNAMYYRSRSNDRGGWTSWAQVIDTGNIGSQTVDKSYHLRVNRSVSTNNTWSTWYWIGQSGQPTWLWGCNDGGNMYVWNPSNFSVKYATSAGSVSNSLNIFGVSYNGSAAKTVTTSTFISQLSEGTSTVTDGTMFITSVVSNSGFSDTSAVNVPYKRKASCLWNYIDSKISSKYLPLAGGTMNGNARIGHGSGNLYIGNSGNDGWIYTQDIASQNGTDNWAIRTSGAAHFGNIHICAKSDYATYDSSIIECYTGDNLYLNYYSPRGVSLCYGGGNVGIGTTSPSYKLDVNGQMRASGFHHGSVNSDNYMLLAGGGYSQGVPVKYWSIEQIIINSSEAVYHQNRGGNYTFITKIESYINGACTLTLQFPSGYDSYNTMIWAMGRTNNSSPSDRANIYATIIYLSGSKYRLVLADDSTLNNGSCQLYFMCF